MASGLWQNNILWKVQIPFSRGIEDQLAHIAPSPLEGDTYNRIKFYKGEKENNSKLGQLLDELKNRETVIFRFFEKKFQI